MAARLATIVLVLFTSFTLAVDYEIVKADRHDWRYSDIQ